MKYRSITSDASSNQRALRSAKGDQTFSPKQKEPPQIVSASNSPSQSQRRKSVHGERIQVSSKNIDEFVITSDDKAEIPVKSGGQKIEEPDVVQDTTTQVPQAPAVDMTDKILTNNPGNFNRKKAIVVDLTEFEQLHREMEDNYLDQLRRLR